MESKNETKPESFQKGRPLLPRASGQPVEDKSSEKGAEKSGIPEGYKPDTSVKYVKGKEKDGSDDHIQQADGSKSSVTSAGKPTAAPMSLPPGHTYEQRVQEQAKRTGVEVVPDESNEILMFKILMQASS